MTEPPPDRPHEPPPDQPHEPPPPEHEKPRQSRRWWISGAAVIVVAVGAAVAFILAPTDGSSGPDRYGQKAVDVVHELHICDNPEVDQGIATCTFQDGIGYAIVATVHDKAERNEFASGANDPGMGAAWSLRATLSLRPTTTCSHRRSATSRRLLLNITATWPATAADHASEAKPPRSSMA
jgi:hypothetical protein